MVYDQNMGARQVAESQKCSFNDRVTGLQPANDFGQMQTETGTETLRGLIPEPE